MVRFSRLISRLTSRRANRVSITGTHPISLGPGFIPLATLLVGTIILTAPELASLTRALMLTIMVSAILRTILQQTVNVQAHPAGITLITWCTRMNMMRIISLPVLT